MTPKGSEIFDRISRSTKPAVLLCASAGVGKTSVCLEIFARRPRNVCAILPNTFAAGQFTEKMLDASKTGVLVGAKIWTFASLAGAILSAGNSPATSISPLQRRLLLREIITALDDAGELAALSAVADTPGIVTALDRTIAELKRSAVDPGRLAEVFAGRNDKNSDLLKIYSAYQQRLHEENLFDVEGVIWQVRDQLAAASPTQDVGLGDIDTLVVDGFIDFTPTQLEVLKLLSRRLMKIVITLPLGDDPREELWRWPMRTKNAIEKIFGDDLETIQAGAAAASPILLTGEKLFDFSGETLAVPAGVKMFSACGKDREVAEATRRIKKLLVDGAAPGEIALVARNLDDYIDTIQQTFAEAGIPLPETGRPLDRYPSVRFCTDIANLVATQFDSSQVLRIIKSSYFSPAALGDLDSQTVRAAEAVIRHCDVCEGENAYIKAAEVMTQTVARAAVCEDDDYKPNIPYALQCTGDAINRVGDFFAALFELAKNSTTAVAMATLPQRLGMYKTIFRTCPPAVAARDMRALRAMTTALENLGDLPAGELGELISAVVPGNTRQESTVAVLDILDARAMRFKHVFIVGCGEGQLPRKFSESSLMTEHHRGELAGRGFHIDRHADLLAREMILFYLAVTRADETLTMSFMSSDSSGKAQMAGSFIESFADICGGFDEWKKTGAFTALPAGVFCAADDEIFSPAAATNAFGERLFTGGGVPASPLHGDDPRLRIFARGAWVMHKRWAGGEYSSFDGMLDDAKLIDELKDEIPRTVFSASRLSTFGQCPWRYFAKYHLGLEELEAPEKQLEPAQAGLFAHEVLYETYSELAKKFSRPLDISAVDEENLHEVFERHFAKACEKIDREEMLYRTLWELQKTALHEMLWNYIKAQRENDLHARSLYFELAFGPDVSKGDCDPASTREPVEVQLGDTTIKLQGRIDRVDEISCDAGDGLAIVDYKTGYAPKFSASADATNAQMPLYIKAVEKLTGRNCMGGFFHALSKGDDTYFAKIKKYKGSWKANDKFDEAMQAAREKIGNFVARMATGKYTLDPAKDACKYCPYRQACHYSPARHSLHGYVPPQEDDE